MQKLQQSRFVLSSRRTQYRNEPQRNAFTVNALSLFNVFDYCAVPCGAAQCRAAPQREFATQRTTSNVNEPLFVSCGRRVVVYIYSPLRQI